MIFLQKRAPLLAALWLLTAAARLAAQDVPFIKAEQITRWKTADTDTVFVLNFWATWCGPCVAELKHFEKLTQKYAAQKVKVVLVSADFKRDVEKKLKPFVKRKKLKSQVVFMDEPTANKWIDLVSPDWSGTIPATLIVSKRKGYEKFTEGEMTWGELEKALKAGL
jgi:thiol-disulfide isomerase/thioredoxin